MLCYTVFVSRQYITTAIDYPNAAPHMGHVLEKILADVCARWMRMHGEVRFQIGTDEHGVKIQQTADKEKMTPKQLVDRNVPLFQELYDRLDISYDNFIRTTDQEKHWPTVTALWDKLLDVKMLEQRTYEGLYCSGCERFITEKDLIDGKCEIHQRPPEKVSETNWFFPLSKETDWLKKILTDGTYAIVPETRAPETLQLIERGLEDVSFSRPKKSLSWGIPVPNDPDQTMYVWCDALTNYYSGVGGFVDPKESKKWWDDAEVTHVIGKDIARFHALIWPAMLKNAGVKIPNRLLIHGFITSEGQKMSKSLGNVIAPAEPIEKIKQGVLTNPKNAALNLTEAAAERMGVDALRFFLMHEIPVGNDGDFSWKRFIEMYDAKLRNLGNLLNRVLSLFKKFGDPLDVPKDDPFDIGTSIGRYTKAMDGFQLSEAISIPFALLNAGDKYINDTLPWKAEPSERAKILGATAELLRHIAIMLVPFMPRTAQEISRQLGVPYAGQMLERSFTIGEPWERVGEPKILFAPIA